MSEKKMLTVYEQGCGEIVEKKSRFIATVIPVSTEEEALEFVASMKKQYWDARHNCYAYVIGEKQELQRCSDDGEPSGTAGRPMLEVLVQEGLHNVAVVVTRYFGGVLLGTGGLVRAYQKATQEGLAAASLVEKQHGYLGELQTEYTELGKVQYILEQNGIAVLDTIYEEKAILNFVAEEQEKDKLEKEIVDKTNGKLIPEWKKEVIYARIEKDVKFF